MWSVVCALLFGMDKERKDVGKCEDFPLNIGVLSYYTVKKLN